MHQYKNDYNLIYNHLSKYELNNNYNFKPSQFDQDMNNNNESENFLQLDINDIHAYHDFIQLIEYIGTNGIGNIYTIYTIFIENDHYLFHLKLLNQEMIDLATNLIEHNKNIKLICGKEFDPDIAERDITDPIEDYRCIDGIIKSFFEDNDKNQYLVIVTKNINDFIEQVINISISFGISK